MEWFRIAIFLIKPPYPLPQFREKYIIRRFAEYCRRFEVIDLLYMKLAFSNMLIPKGVSGFTMVCLVMFGYVK